MRRITNIFIIFILMQLVTANLSFISACTTFVLKGEKKSVFGRNFDFYPTTAYIMENKRNLSKQALVPEGEKPAKWISKYGSITFNQIGMGFPYGGMNEKGLVVAQMMCEGQRFCPKDQRPVLTELQWIQYQLDTATTVEDVVNSNKHIRILENSVPLHFLILDKNGDALIVEHINGKLIAYRDKELPIVALANSPYKDSLGYARELIENDKENDIPFTVGSNQRFGRAAEMARKFKDNKGKSIIEYSFNILKNVSQPHTQYSVVFDPTGMTIHYKSKNNPSVQSFALSEFDFDCSKPTKVINIVKTLQSIDKDFESFAEKINQIMMDKVLECSFLKNLLWDVHEDYIKYPLTFKCVNNSN